MHLGTKRQGARDGGGVCHEHHPHVGAHTVSACIYAAFSSDRTSPGMVQHPVFGSGVSSVCGVGVRPCSGLRNPTSHSRNPRSGIGQLQTKISVDDTVLPNYSAYNLLRQSALPARFESHVPMLAGPALDPTFMAFIRLLRLIFFNACFPCSCQQYQTNQCLLTIPTNFVQSVALYLFRHFRLLLKPHRFQQPRLLMFC